MDKGQIQYDFGGDVDINGIKIHYEYFGKKDRPCMVLFNGVAMETKSWYQYLSHILPKIDLLLWDYRGQGGSTSDDNPYHVEEFADYLNEILDVLQLKPAWVNLAGFSTGTLIEAEFLRKYSHRVNKAFMSGVVLTPEKNMEYQSQLGMELLRRNMIDLWIDSLYASLFSDQVLVKIEPFIPAMKKSLYERYKDRTPALVRILEAQNIYLKEIQKYFSEYKTIQNQIMIIAGEEDRLSPVYYQKKLMDIFPHIDYRQYPGCGHLIFAEKPADLFEEVIHFLLQK